MLTEKKEKLPGKSAKGSGCNLKLKVSRRRKVCGTLPKRECWREREREGGALPKEETSDKAMHRRQLSQQLVEGGCGRQSRRKGEHKQGRQSRNSATCGMSEGGKERVAVVCNRHACCDFPSCVDETVFQKGSDEEVVDLSGDKLSIGVM